MEACMTDGADPCLVEEQMYWKATGVTCVHACLKKQGRSTQWLSY